ncbi:ABC transporter permease [candidate division KSB1 bacterium]
MKLKPSICLRFTDRVLKHLAEDEIRYSITEYMESKYNKLKSEKGSASAVIFCLILFTKTIVSLFYENIVWSIIMFKNYFKVASRLLLKNKSFSVINITGLAAGMTISILILLYVVNEITYDRFHENSGNLFRIGTKVRMQGRENEAPGAPGPLGPMLKEQSPEILSFARVQKSNNHFISYEDQLFEESGILYADPDIFNILSIKVVNGDPETFLNAPFSLVLTEETAAKYFGDEDPVGKVLRWDNSTDYTVTGVVKKMPENTHFKFNMLVSFSTLYKTHPEVNTWIAMNCHTYIELKEGTPHTGLAEKYTNNLLSKVGAMAKQYGVEIELRLTAVTDIHLHSELRGEISPRGNPAMIRIFATIALFILLIACINFMNLSTSRSMQRAKEVGMRKVLGAPKGRLIFQFLSEALILSFISIIISIILIKFLLPVFNQLVDMELTYNPVSDWKISLGIIGLTLLVGILSGLYPAVYLSSFVPVKVLASRLKTGSGHRVFRNGLVVLQFVITIVLITGTFIIYRQLNFVKKSDLGFDKEHVVVISLEGEVRRKHDVFKSNILQIPGVVNASTSSLIPGRGRSTLRCRFEGVDEAKVSTSQYMEADEDYLETMGIKLTAGRTFSKEFPADRSSSLLINETLLSELGWDSPLGKAVFIPNLEKARQGAIQFDAFQVIGVVSDFHFASFHEKISGFFIRMPGSNSYMSVKIRPENIAGTIGFIRRQWEQLEPSVPFEYSFFEEEIENLYRTEQRLGTILTYFTIFSIMIACLGLFGLASFTAERRTKEIGIRKVLGATTTGVVGLLSKSFLKWVIIASVIAWPAAYYAMNTWLTRFAYRVDPGIWVFVLSGLIALVVAWISVAFQAVRAATANPVDSLRWE